MPTTVRRTKASPEEITSIFREHLFLKAEAKTISTRSDSLKDKVKKWLSSRPKGFYRNATGSYFYDLPETVSVKGKNYRGMELRRAVSTLFNEEKAEEIVKEKDLWEEATVRVIDQEAINRLVAEGKITEKELDAMFEDKESFSFWPVEGEVN